MKPKRAKDFRKKLKFYLIECRTPLGKLIDIVIITLNLTICAILAIETYPISERTRTLLWRLETFIVVFFIIEYAARFYAASDRRRQLRDLYSIIDLVAIIPTLLLWLLPQSSMTANLGFIRVIRAFRVFRIFRFLRFTADPDFFFGKLTVPLLRVIRLVFTIIMIFFYFGHLILSSRSA